jgi:hypothetical protein
LELLLAARGLKLALMLLVLPQKIPPARPQPRLFKKLRVTQLAIFAEHKQILISGPENSATM